jgi:hypothetical protein
MSTLSRLKKQQALLHQEITSQLDSFLVGTIAKSPSMSGFNLTTKVGGKTVTLYVRKDLVLRALEMGRRYQRLWSLIQKLSRINWEVLKLESK